MTPLFTLGVTVYKRRELLNETLASIVAQTFGDFEVIIGNDYPEEPLTPQMVVKDPRIRIVNHEQNLGEVENMNVLLRLARGRYVTWIADDDLYSPKFLEQVEAALRKFDYPACVYTSFTLGSTIPEVNAAEAVSLRGSEFIRLYLADSLKVIGTMGVFDRNYLNEIGGLEHLVRGSVGLYTEYHQLIRSGLLERIAYIDTPLIVYRAHLGSWGCTNVDVELFKEAGEILSGKGLDVLRRPELIKDFDHNLTRFLKKLTAQFIEIAEAKLTQPLNTLQLLRYLFFSRRYISSLQGSRLYWRALCCLARVQATILWAHCKRSVLSRPTKLMTRIAASASFRFRRIRSLTHR